MGSERRCYDRQPSFQTVQVFTMDESGKEKAFSVMLRDRSRFGFGGVFVGQEDFEEGQEFFVREAGRPVKTAQLVWKYQAASFVTLLGFQVQEDVPVV